MAGLGNPLNTGRQLAAYAKQSTGIPQSQIEQAYDKMQTPVQDVGSAMASKGISGGEIVSSGIDNASQLADALKIDSTIGSSGYSNGYYDRIEQRNPVVGLNGIDFGKLSNEDLHAYLIGAYNNG